MISGKSVQPKGQMVGEASELYSDLLLFIPSHPYFFFIFLRLAPSEPAYIIFFSCFSRATIAESVTSEQPIVLKALNLSLPAFADGYRGEKMEWVAFMWRLMASM